MGYRTYETCTGTMRKYNRDSYTGEILGHDSIDMPVELADWDIMLMVCSCCGYALPYDEFSPTHRRPETAGSRRRVTCRVCQAQSTRRFHRRVRERACEVGGCSGAVLANYSTRMCRFHANGGSHALCGGSCCRAGWDAPSVVARDSDKASQQCHLYLLRVVGEGCTALVFGLSTALDERMRTYRRAVMDTHSILGVELLAKYSSDYLSCCIAERSLLESTERSTWTPDCQGMRRENMTDTVQNVDVFHSVAAVAVSQSITADGEGWESRRRNMMR